MFFLDEAISRLLHKIALSQSTLLARAVFSLMLPLTLLAACTKSAASTPPDPTGTAPLPATFSLQPSETPVSSLTPTLPVPATPTPSGEVVLAAVGDLMLGRTVGDQILEKGPQVVFAGVEPVLEAADLRVGNLECALTDRGTPEPGKTYTLKAPPAAAAALQSAKFDVVSLANNHAMDFGFEGVQSARTTLLQAGIASVGAGADYTQAHMPIILERNGLRLAFLAYLDVPVERDGFDARAWIATADRPGIAWADPNAIQTDVVAAKSKADLVIVLLHSGTEIGQYQSVLSGEQIQAAHTAVDAGAALVLGSHPHQLETIERYHGGLIAYSLGNFVFDDYLGIANASIILQVTLDRNGIQSYTYVPVLIANGLPHVIPAEQVPAIGTLVAP